MVLALSACTAPAPRPGGVTAGPDREVLWAQRLPALAVLERFTLLGRLAVRLPGDAVTASLRWQQAPGQFDISLHGPFNRGNLELRGDAGGVQLRTAEFQGSAPTLDRLMLEQFGWTLPVDGLPWWVRGMPMPGDDFSGLELDAEGRMIALDQAGWHIAVERYDSVGPLQLPRLVTLSTGDIRLRLSIRDWQPETSS